jgi:hypothetical protein
MSSQTTVLFIVAVMIILDFRVIYVNEIFSGCQPCLLVKDGRRFRDHLWPYHQNLKLKMTNILGTISVSVIRI